MKHLKNCLELSSRKIQHSVCEILRYSALFLINTYKVIFSGAMGTNCRFYPTCSHYAAEAFAQHDPLQASKLTLKRLFACRPFGKSGYDPIPRSTTHV